jgi:hypothetical protein
MPSTGADRPNKCRAQTEVITVSSRGRSNHVRSSVDRSNAAQPNEDHNKLGRPNKRERAQRKQALAQHIHKPGRLQPRLRLHRHLLQWRHAGQRMRRCRPGTREQAIWFSFDVSSLQTLYRHASCQRRSPVEYTTYVRLLLIAPGPLPPRGWITATRCGLSTKVYQGY